MRMLRAVLVAGVLGAPGAAWAHAFRKEASPAVGSTVTRAPAEVAIDFTEGIEPLFSTVAVTAADGARVDRGAAHLDGDPARLAVALGPLGAGRYTVEWHVVAVDTHRTQGSFSFTWI